VIVLLASPCLWLSFLPMTDLPQHAAIAAILEHLGDAGWGFDEWYERALGRTLYFLPYGLTIVFGQVVPAEFATRILVFLSVIAYPLGVWALLRATHRPGMFALLALPLMYNRAFFWGFSKFNLGLGLALFAIALLERDERTRRGDAALGRPLRCDRDYAPLRGGDPGRLRGDSVARRRSTRLPATSPPHGPARNRRNRVARTGE
jgi:hypothetical protein